MKKILIVEDELLIAKGIAATLTEHNYTVLKIATTGEDAIEVAQELKPEIVLMDITLKGDIDGISTAKILKRQHNISVIFITKHTDKQIYLNADETAPCKYITKPFTDEELLLAVELADDELYKLQMDNTEGNSKDNVFVLTGENTYTKVHLQDLLYLKSNGAYTNIFVEQNDDPEVNKYLVSISSNHVAEGFAYNDLCKVHKSYYVNVNQITGVSNGFVHIGSKSIPLSEKYRPELLKRLKILKKSS